MVERSYAIQVRDGIMARIKAMPHFKPFHFSTNKALQIQPQSIPFCGVYLIEETGLPEGDANTAETEFRLIVRYGFSVIVLNNEPEQSEYMLDAAYVTLTRNLFNDPTLYGNKNALIQAFTRGNRTHQFGAIGADNEQPISELRFELTCDLGVENYPPIIPDDLETIHVETGFPLGGTPAEIEAVQQVKVEYDIPQNE